MFKLSDVEKRFLELMDIEVTESSDEVGGYAFTDKKSGNKLKGEVYNYGSSWRYGEGSDGISIKHERTLRQQPTTRKITVSDLTLEYVIEGNKMWSIDCYGEDGPYRIESYIKDDDIYTHTEYAETINIDSEGPYQIKFYGSGVIIKNGFREQKNVDFTPQNYENVFERIIGELRDEKLKKALTKVIPLLSVNIPIDILETRINQLVAVISEDPSKARIYEGILGTYREMKEKLQEYADIKTSDGGKRPKQKHPGENNK